MVDCLKFKEIKLKNFKNGRKICDREIKGSKEDTNKQMLISNKIIYLILYFNQEKSF